MNGEAVQLRVAGQTYQVVTSAGQNELHRLAEKVEHALFAVTPRGRQPSPQSLVLAAISLAHELEQERAKRVAAEERYRETLKNLLGRVDQVLADTENVELATSEVESSGGVGHAPRSTGRE
jgi:cell division protein ZapA